MAAPLFCVYKPKEKEEENSENNYGACTLYRSEINLRSQTLIVIRDTEGAEDRESIWDDPRPSTINTGPIHEVVQI